jgi:hypothetical protein
VEAVKRTSRVPAKREAALLQKHGKPFAKSADGKSDRIFNFPAGKGTIVGDILSPAISGEEWGLPTLKVRR